MARRVDSTLEIATGTARVGRVSGRNQAPDHLLGARIRDGRGEAHHGLQESTKEAGGRDEKDDIHIDNTYSYRSLHHRF